MKSVRLVFLTLALLPPALSGASTAPSRPAAAANQNASDLTSLREMAERGNAVAQYNLGLAHLQGRQTPVNLIEAYAWLNLAAEGGSTGRALDTVLEALTPEQLKAAQRRLEALRAGNPYLRLTAVTAAPKPPAAAVPIIGEPIVRPAPVSAPIISIPPVSAATPTETKRWQEQLAERDLEKRQLAAELANTRKEVATLKTQLSSRTSAANELGSAQSHLKDAQATIAGQAAELAAARAEAVAARMDHAKLQAQLTAAREARAVQNASASQAIDTAAALERERDAHATTRASVEQLKKELAELNATRTNFERDSAARTATAERAQAAVADEAKKLSTHSADLLQKTDSLAGELKSARAELATVRQKLAWVEGEHSAARTQLAQTRSALEAATNRAESAAALRADAAAQAELQLTAGRNQVSALERELENTKTASNRIISEKAAAEVALANANQKLAESTRALSTLRQQVAESAQKSTATSDQRIAALQSELNETKSRLGQKLADAERAAVSREAELAKLRSSAVSAGSRPAISAGDLDAAQKTAKGVQQQLAEANRELSTLRQQAATARDLELRVRQLESEKAALVMRPADSTPANDALARTIAAQAEAENKLSTALRSYTLVARERDELKARVDELSAKFSNTAQALTTAEAEAKAATESASASVASTAELETLRNRAAAAERLAEASRAELARANQLLAALRPGLAEPTRPTAPAGEPARTHTIAPGETLSSISLRYYGTAARWSDILSANRDVLVDERSFAAGRTLRIP